MLLLPTMEKLGVATVVKLKLNGEYDGVVIDDTTDTDAVEGILTLT